VIGRQVLPDRVFRNRPIVPFDTPGEYGTRRSVKGITLRIPSQAIEEVA